MHDHLKGRPELTVVLNIRKEALMPSQIAKCHNYELKSVLGVLARPLALSQRDN